MTATPTQPRTPKREGLTLLPPHPDHCPDCATKHEPEQPHNQPSLYYQMAFRAAHGRWPTWADAMAHCDDETRRLWTEELAAMGETIGEGA